MTSVTTPPYRYRVEAPEVISVPAGELVAHLPEELRGETGAPGGLIDLPCSEILCGNVPRISLGRLCELASGTVRIPEGRDPSEAIALPPGWIALHFRMMTRREELTPDSAIESDPAVAESGHLTIDVEAPLIDSEPASLADVPAPKAADEKGNESRPVGEGESNEEAAAPAKEEVTMPKKGFLSSLPIFRRTEASGPGEALESSPIHEPGKNAQEKSVSPAGNELVPPALPLERLWKLDPQDELADGSALQALFMTDEKLTLERVVSKAGELPGLDACVLAHADRVICASKAPSGTDLQTLSGQAMTMLSQIRDSSEKMGLGAVPAVTLHADRGVVSFLHRGELCLLVLHADRGFVPGVRERLQEMLAQLSKALPALPPAPAR